DAANGAADRMRAGLARFDKAGDLGERAAALLDDGLQQVMIEHGPREDLSQYHRTLELIVDRKQAAFAAWYEMFPRSQGTAPGKGATFDDCIRRLPEVRDLGFDVVYFVPIHPIGRTNRKGANNSLRAGPNDPGSPYAIGAKEGGHDAIHPDLGTFDDFARL